MLFDILKKNKGFMAEDYLNVFPEFGFMEIIEAIIYAY